MRKPCPAPLTANERRALRLRDEGKTWAEIGEALKLTKQRAHAIGKNALRKLASRARGISHGLL